MRLLRAPFLLLLGAAVTNGFLSSRPSSDLNLRGVIIDSVELGYHAPESDEALDKRAAAACGQAPQRLSRRANDLVDVKPGDAAAKNFGDTGELTTHDLVTCIGVAIRGKDKFTGGSVRVLAHFYATKTLVDHTFGIVKQKCEGAFLDMSKDRVFVMSILDNDAPVPQGKFWDQEAKNAGEEAFHDIRNKLEAYLGVCMQRVDVRTLGMSPSASMSFRSDGSVTRTQGQQTVVLLAAGS